MLESVAVAPDGQQLSEQVIRDVLERGLGGRFANARVLVLIPDHTRTVPLPPLFRMVVDILRDTKQLDFMVALGTHPPLLGESLNKLVGITADERHTTFARVGLLNHAWQDSGALTTLGTLTRDQIKSIAGEHWHASLGGDVPVRINKHVMDYDHLIILGPTFPHEVVGFSGGAKYLFPGISGPEMINVTHWLGALITIMDMIGLKSTPVRDMIHAAAALVPTPVTLVSMVVEHGGLAGIFVGSYLEGYEAAADLSSQRHIVWLDKPVEGALSFAPPMYDELWTGAKAMYKLEPVIADGGELVVYAPHLDTVSHVHGKYIYEVGYHVRDYFLKQWDRFSHVPTGVLAHSTHLKGAGTFDSTEHPRINVTLSSKISEDDCATLNLGYRDPDTIRSEEWQEHDKLYVPKAGEMLYRLRR